MTRKEKAVANKKATKVPKLKLLGVNKKIKKAKDTKKQVKKVARPVRKVAK